MQQTQQTQHALHQALTSEGGGDLPEGLGDLVAVLRGHHEGRQPVLLRELVVLHRPHRRQVLQVVCVSSEGVGEAWLILWAVVQKRLVRWL